MRPPVLPTAQPRSRREVLRSALTAALALPLGAQTWSCRRAEPVAAEPAPAVRWRDGLRPAPEMPEPRSVEANGIRMAVYERGGGTPVVLCHGFPELAYSWRHQLPALADAGYRAIAPDQRGYGLTDAPEDVASYTLDMLCADLVGMLDALEIDRAVFCGHDWGGGVVWLMPRLHPERVLGVVGVNTPAFHPGHPARPSSLAVVTDRYYVNTFQEPGVAEAALSSDVRRTFDAMLREGGIWDAEAFVELPPTSPERQLDLLTMIERGDFPGEPLLSDEEIRYFVDTFEVTGFTGGLNWYRASRQLQPDWSAVSSWDIDVPCLYVGAEDDVVLPPSSADGMERYIADLEKHTIAECGHWTQQEEPEELNRVLVDWLGRKIT